MMAPPSVDWPATLMPRSMSQLANVQWFWRQSRAISVRASSGSKVVIQMPVKQARTYSDKRSASVMGFSWNGDGEGKDVVNEQESSGFGILVREPEEDFGPGDQEQ